VLGVYDTGVPGPTFVSLGGIHGNEPAGVYALLRILAGLGERRVGIRGRFVALGGNLAALHRSRRFLDRDLNRAWLPENLDALWARAPALDCAEDLEQRELLEVLDQLRHEARGPLIFLDLHTSSAPGAAFACMSDTLANRRIASELPIPLILGLEECIDGAIMEYFNRHCAIAVAVEGGRHQDPRSVDHLAAAVWLGLFAAGMLAPDSVDLAAHRTCLRAAASGLPRVLEIRHRQAIKAGDTFVMEPGFTGFQPIKKGELLARCNGEQLFATESGRILLPLYQGQGEDGYFVVREVSRFGLAVAALMRRCRLQAIVHWLPGVRRHPERLNTLIVGPRAARLFAVQLFHLLGFRRQRTVDGLLCFSRRPDPALRS
jgi:succinylglutamate desuccinylase